MPDFSGFYEQSHTTNKITMTQLIPGKEENNTDYNDYMEL